MGILKEITPKSFQCAAGICPAVYTTDHGDKLYIVGNKVGDLKRLGIADKVGENEQVIVVDREMIRQLFEN